MFCAAVAQATNVEVIVDNALYNTGQITASLNTYISDLQTQGYNPILTTTAFTSAAALRSHLAANYNAPGGLAGAVMIGDLPVARYERYNETFSGFDNVPYESFANDLYYMDVNGSWTDSRTTGGVAGSNGILDTHTGNVAPEIFVSRMDVSKLAYAGSTQASLINSYLAKDHAYRQGQLRMPQNGLAYVDDTWSANAAGWGASLKKSLAGSVTVVSSPTSTTAADYVNRIASATSPKYESVYLASHSTFEYHTFSTASGGSEGAVHCWQIENADPQALSYNLFCCSAGDYDSDPSQPYLAGQYVFRSSKGLLAVSPTKTGGMLDLDSYYTPLGNGATYGEAYLQWWQSEFPRNTPENPYRAQDWFYGMTMTGDPFLRTQAYAMPEPSTIVLLAIGGVGLMACAWRRRRAK